MKSKDEKLFGEIIKEIWGTKISIELGVALTIVLNTFDFYVSGEYKFNNQTASANKISVEGPFSFSYEAISHILSEFEINGEKYKPIVWRNKWLIEAESLYKNETFIFLMNDVEEKIKNHLCILKIN